MLEFEHNYTYNESKGTIMTQQKQHFDINTRTLTQYYRHKKINKLLSGLTLPLGPLRYLSPKKWRGVKNKLKYFSEKPGKGE